MNPPRRTNVPRRLAAFALALLASAAAHGQLPASGPIELEADSSEIDRKNNRLIFHNVRIQQGELGIRAALAQGTNLEFSQAEWLFRGQVQITSANATLSADQAVLTFVDHRVRRADLEGAPVVFEQTRPGQPETTRGRAARILYDFDSQVLTLAGDAWLSEGQNEITGENITYEIGAQRVIAGADENGERVRITIVPPPESEEAPDDGIP
jgi:lipopolysaccharide transport protein LptA